MVVPGSDPPATWTWEVGSRSDVAEASAPDVEYRARLPRKQRMLGQSARKGARLPGGDEHGRARGGQVGDRQPGRHELLAARGEAPVEAAVAGRGNAPRGRAARRFGLPAGGRSRSPLRVCDARLIAPEGTGACFSPSWREGIVPARLPRRLASVVRSPPRVGRVRPR